MATKKKAATKPAAKKNTPVKKAAPAKKTVAAKPAPKTVKPAAPKKAEAKPVTKKPEKVPAKPATKPVVPASKAAPAKNVVTAKTDKKPEVKQSVMPKNDVKPASAKAPVGKEEKKPEAKKAEVKKPEAKPAAAKTPVAKEEKIATAPAPVSEEIKAEEKTKLLKIPPAKKPAPAVQKVPTKFVMPEMKTKTIKKYEPEFTKSVLDQPDAIPTGPTLRYSDSELQEFRELIQKKLDQAKKELTYLQGLITRKDEMGGDENENRYMTMEDGSMSMEREQLAQMASRQINYIDHLEKALMRIENRTYGICRVTGKLIDKARLRAVPHATLSIEAKQMMNK
jgi:RNA polymerase-binding transcription factor DksA